MASGALGMDPERRKIRKGTRSCWECKRRKVRCTYASPAHSVCIGCSRRCTKCISQEFPDQKPTPASRSRLVGARIGEVEAMVKELANLHSRRDSTAPPELMPSQDSRKNDGILTPTACDTPETHDLSPQGRRMKGSITGSVPDHLNLTTLHDLDDAIRAEGSLTRTAELQDISKALLTVYPSREDINLILDSCGNLSLYFAKILGTSYTELENENLESMNELRNQYSYRAHPVLIARQMLQLAIVLQQASPATHDDLAALSEPVGRMTKRLADTSIRLVTRNDEILGSIEGLFCIMLEAVYEANQGNLRRSWLTIRRAVGVGQLMNIQRHNNPSLECLDPIHPIDPHFLWFRLLYADRFMCIMLGLPQASSDTSIASEAVMKVDTALGRLERLQCCVASRILERNERGPSSSDFSTTMDIDAELQKVASTMPSRWWVIPNLPALRDETELFWETSRLLAQIVHYNLVNNLHLPYMLYLSSGVDQRRFDYSRITCVSASRELLARYVMFRSFNHIAYCCRGLDFVALMASLTLLLAHLDGHRTTKQADNFLIHQRFSDRGMMEQVLDNMEMVADVNKDLMSCKSASLLRQLLDIEEDAAKGSSYIVADKKSGGISDKDAFQIQVPYIGLITITKDGGITRDAPPQSRRPFGNSQTATVGEMGDTQLSSSGFAAPGQSQTSISDCNSVGFPQHYDDSISRAAIEDPLGSVRPMGFTYPPLTAGTDQWVFQGVDMAFFDSLMRETNVQPYNDSNDLLF
ncbi:hypothetical protein BX600DRAFT_551977 [Xylariales sp. PMI_506]|nr:hypothetical protein BX600DRAFT_551977 [Xylariales sp. PMI_506]